MASSGNPTFVFKEETFCFSTCPFLFQLLISFSPRLSSYLVVTVLSLQSEMIRCISAGLITTSCAFGISGSKTFCQLSVSFLSFLSRTASLNCGP